MSGFDTACAASFVNSEGSRVNSPPFFDNSSGLKPFAAFKKIASPRAMSAERVKFTLGQRSAAVSTASPQEPVNETFDQLLAEVRACTVCAPHLPFGPRPVLRGRPSARLLIISHLPCPSRT